MVHSEQTFCNPFNHNVEKRSNILLKSSGVSTVRFLKYVQPFFKIVNERVKYKKDKILDFNKPSKKDGIPLQQLTLKIYDLEIEKKDLVKFLGNLLDEQLCWKQNLKATEIKIAKKEFSIKQNNF